MLIIGSVASSRQRRPAAHPDDDHRPAIVTDYQVSADFADDSAAESYPTKFSPRDFLQFFGEGSADSAFIDHSINQFALWFPGNLL
jgi:hypothetical protein